MAAVISGAILAGMPILFAALGETISEQAGVLNIGLEGMMLFGAYAGFVVANWTGSSWVGFLAAIIAGMAVSLLMVVFCVRMGRDQIVVGIAILLTMEGLTSLLHQVQFGESYPRLGSVPTVAIPGLSKIPVLGPSIFSQPLIVYIGIALIFAAGWMLCRTNLGLNIRAAGWKPVALDNAGVDVLNIRTIAVLSTGALAGLGGGYMAIVTAGIFVPFMTGGFGFIAIVIAMLARGRPVWVLIGSLLFGIALSIATALQLVGINVSTDLVQMLPFVTVIVALALFARHTMLPAALATPFVRGQR
ncbi:MAG: ABC transporter permease [Actinobacteria bacterium]|nr:ABC transporter permease [Actinomycetota bacterium]